MIKISLLATAATTLLTLSSGVMAQEDDIFKQQQDAVKHIKPNPPSYISGAGAAGADAVAAGAGAITTTAVAGALATVGTVIAITSNQGNATTTTATTATH